jgi:hypothetical protein
MFRLWTPLIVAALMLAPPAEGLDPYRSPVTVITVNTSQDLDTSMSATCTANPTECTLRRAIVESRGLTDVERPVQIAFDIPTSDPGYDAIEGVWVLNILATTDASVFRRVKKETYIDGTTQPGGTSSGPKIFVVGPGTGQKDGPIIGDVAGDDSCIVRGLGFQNFKTHMTVNTDTNRIENNWFGLTVDGQEISLRNDEPEDGSGNTGVSLSSGADSNVLQGNVFAGLDGVAAAIRGTGNSFQQNLVGTRGDGSVPKITTPSLVCTTPDWLGGGGVSVSGGSNTVQHNTIAGLRQEIFDISTQPDGIRADGDEHVIQGNSIGVDASAARVGVCGRGIYLGGANSPEETQVLNNTIVNPEMSAISINGALSGENTLTGNIIVQEDEWIQIPGNSEPEDAIQLGPLVPDALRTFVPAKVTSINGTTVTGTAGDGSPCPSCLVEVFLDDGDTTVEALASLDQVSAAGDGTWSAALPEPLLDGEGLRTLSTSTIFGTIPNMGPGTSTGLSELYGSGPPPEDVDLDGTANAGDLAELLRVLAGAYSPAGDPDVNGDDQVDEHDLLQIVSAIFG